MAKNIFEPLKDLQGNQMRGASWYRNAVSLIVDRVSQNKLMRQGKVNARPSAGRMNLFVYDPKYKKTLPFYDTFPLVLPLETIKGGFMGLNFHYLPYPLRFRLLERLQKFATNSKFDSSTKLLAGYGDVSSINLIKPAVCYINSSVIIFTFQRTLYIRPSNFYNTTITCFIVIPISITLTIVW